jgi:hypothetical protein
VTDCGAPRHDGQDEPTLAEPHATLCQSCRLGLLRDLRRLPGLHADLEHMPATGDGDGTGLPFSDPAYECRSQIHHDLRFWAREITAIRGMDAPPVLDGGWSERPVPVLAGWLAGQVTWCSFRDWAPLMAGAISADYGRAVALLNPYVKRVFEIPGEDGICLHCPARVTVTVYASDGDRRRSFIGCPGCGLRWEPEQWLSYGRQVIRRRDAIAS